jgi:hypothetical protein
MEEGAARQRGMPMISEKEVAAFYGSEKLRLSLFFINNLTDRIKLKYKLIDLQSPHKLGL